MRVSTVGWLSSSFARMSQMGTHLCRSIGLKRVNSHNCHNHLANLIYNMNRYACLVK